MHHTTELVRWLHGHRHRLAAMWLASYGNMSDFLTGLDGQGEYALTTVQWLPSMPYADSYFGTAAQYAADFTDAMGNAPSYFSAAATAAGLVLLTALRQSIEACDVGSLTQGQQLGQDGLEGVDADAFMWGAHGMLCSGPRGVGGNRSGVLGTEQLRYSLDTLSVDTFFGPVEFNAFRQNSIHPALVAQVRCWDWLCWYAPTERWVALSYVGTYALHAGALVGQRNGQASRADQRRTEIST